MALRHAMLMTTPRSRRSSGAALPSITPAIGASTSRGFYRHLSRKHSLAIGDVRREHAAELAAQRAKIRELQFSLKALRKEFHALRRELNERDKLRLVA
jgi:hypothetical protein